MIYRSALEKLGYKLLDCGNHWRARAVFRNGKTNTSLIIYKDTGVWRDFGGDQTPKPFKALVQETLRTNDDKILKEYLPSGDNVEVKYEKPEKIEMEKIYQESDLEKLLPMTTFYEKKGISAETQKIFKCGYAGGGKMYRRIVFPIYNLDMQIHGFSGRTITSDSKTPKWKHVGRKNGWVYPHSVAGNYIERDEEVILVESIGDCLALHEAGYKNVLVTFGLDASAKLISYLNQFNLNRIIVATNNDKGKEINSGALASIKTAAKLAQTFDLSVISINPPLANDFGDMLEGNNNFKEWYARKDKWNLGSEKTLHWFIKEIESFDVLKKNTHCKKFLKSFK